MALWMAIKLPALNGATRIDTVLGVQQKARLQFVN